MNKTSTKNIITLAASILGIIATFLPWMSTTTLGITVTATGTSGDGWISFVFFVVIAILTLINLKKDLSMGSKIAITILAILAILVALSKILAAGELAICIGVYLVIISGIVSAVMPWLPTKQ